MADRFSLPRFSTIDKDIEIEDSEYEIKLTVDYDDVNHPVVKKLAEKVVRILNKHWDED